MADIYRMARNLAATALMLPVSIGAQSTPARSIFNDPEFMGIFAKKCIVVYADISSPSTAYYDMECDGDVDMKTTSLRNGDIEVSWVVDKATEWRAREFSKKYPYLKIAVRGTLEAADIDREFSRLKAYDKN